ncbi:Gfo/Idh/MocA family oxidoreductase, partial [bacterium]|nr:Gfo/Idh/MocA family oxidoreductase [bacterium]
MKRRQFLKKSGGWAAGLALPCFIPARVLGRGGVAGPNSRIVMGCIGTGSMGTGHVRSFLGYDSVQVAAVCDVRREHRERAGETVNRHYGNKDCRAYLDFRELLARPDIDAVCIAVPDHWHAIIGLEAARLGKHMYYEKP